MKGNAGITFNGTIKNQFPTCFIYFPAPSVFQSTNKLVHFTLRAVAPAIRRDIVIRNINHFANGFVENIAQIKV